MGKQRRKEKFCLSILQAVYHARYVQSIVLDKALYCVEIHVYIKCIFGRYGFSINRNINNSLTGIIYTPSLLLVCKLRTKYNLMMLEIFHALKGMS